MEPEDFSWLSQVIPFLLLLGILEYVTGRLRDLPTVRMNDCLHSWSAALISAMPRLLVTSLDTAAYAVVYDAMYKSSSPDDSSLFRNWFLVFLATDLGYYWFHRAAHEINVLWAAHQVHHSSEDFNISVSLRQSVVQQFVTW
ncbi:alkylglycerol monooxygenase, partial [Paramuricea clavata]